MSPHASVAEITGLIIAGGKATRMGGNDKALCRLGDAPLLAHVIRRFAPQVGPLLVNSNRAPQDYDCFGLSIIADLLPDHPGPLAGLHAGLTHCDTPLLASVPCDAPRLPCDLVERLRDALRSGETLAAVAETQDGMEPTFLLCRREALATITPYLASGRRSVHGWLASLPAATVRFDDAAAFANINTPEELAALADRPD
jgi:molybdopterin-guanine dinucleotide biosynthesis protein A